ncbi:MAG: DUF177 domain-containing protein [Candidatus Hydrogenedentes bacterium]|nr:DUF177 domain-containing protein [Candidatus Hydrogenedentota bacterium]
MTAKLQIPVLSIGDDGLDLDVRLSVAEVQPPETDPVPLDEVQVTGCLTDLGGGEYLFRGRVRGEYAQPCDRCLEEARAALDSAVAWVYVEARNGEALSEMGGDDDDDGDGAEREKLMIAGREVNLAPQVWEEIVLSAPLKLVCKDSCLGLCPRCGANLNGGPCGCPAAEGGGEPQNTPLSVLASLFPDLADDKNRKE